MSDSRAGQQLKHLAKQSSTSKTSKEGLLATQPPASRSPASASRSRPRKTAASLLLVTNTQDSGRGSLRHALIAANTVRDGRIQFAPGVEGEIILRTALPDITSRLTIEGPGAAKLAIRRSRQPAVPDFRIFSINAGSHVTIEGIAISDGSEFFGGGLFNAGTLTLKECIIRENSSEFLGGGIFNFHSAVLLLERVVLEGNRVGLNGGGLFNAGRLTLHQSSVTENFAGFLGGGLFNFLPGVLTLNQSTVAGNSADLDGGGAVNASSLTADQSTIAQNTAARGVGGGVYNNSGTLELRNCTMAENIAPSGGAIFNAGRVVASHSTIANNATTGGPGGGIFSQGEQTLTNTIVAKNRGAIADIFGSVISLGNNLIGEAAEDGGWITEPTSPKADRLNQDPLLDPQFLHDNGGPTMTIALMSGSPALQSGTCLDAASAFVETDQRGAPRAKGAPASGALRCDIGAFQASSSSV